MKFLTIRQAAAAGIMTEHYLRLLVAQERCPGVYSGNRFLINIDALQEQLEAESHRYCQKADEGRSCDERKAYRPDCWPAADHCRDYDVSQK